MKKVEKRREESDAGTKAGDPTSFRLVFCRKAKADDSKMISNAPKTRKGEKFIDRYFLMCYN